MMLIVLKFYTVNLFIISEFCNLLKVFKKTLLMAISLNSTYVNVQELVPKGNEQI